MLEPQLKKLSAIHTLVFFIRNQNILYYDKELSISVFSTLGILQLNSDQPRSMNQL